MSTIIDEKGQYDCRFHVWTNYVYDNIKKETQCQSLIAYLKGYRREYGGGGRSWKGWVSVGVCTI